MGVMVNGKWREDLADPNPNGGSNLTSASQSPTMSGGGGGGGSSPSVATPQAPSGTYYQTKNGTQTLATMEQQLRSAGWNGGEDVATAYARTTGAPVVVGGVSPGKTGPGQTTTSPGGQININPEDMAKLQTFFGQTSGFSREELAEKKRQFDAQMAAAEAQWTREGLPLLQIKQRLAALEDEKFRADLAIAQRQATTQEGQLGLDYLKTASSLGGPSDYFQSVDFNRGASARGDVPVFLNSLANNTALPSFNASGMVSPDPQTAAGLAQKLTGTGATSPGGYSPDAALNQISSIFKRGVTGLQAGSLERLDPSELALLKSGGQKLGYDTDAWLRAYGKSGVGQQAFA